MPAWQIPKIEADPEYASYTRTTTSDSNGRFTFENVAPGKYYVATQIMWRPKSEVPIDEETGQKLLRMIDALEELDDVQQVYANFDVAEDVLRRLTAA